MGLTRLENTVLIYSQTGYKEPLSSDVPGSTPFVTGNLIVDHFLNHMLVDNGIRITVREGVIYRQIHRAEIVDEVKAAWFLMRWA
jgi:hypothetical protein